MFSSNLRPANAESIARAATILRDGGLVAFPTETVYGLGADALNAAAVARIFAAKGRPAFNPLIVHAANLEAARELATLWPHDAQRLAERFWPGPLTLVLPKIAAIPDNVTAGLPNVALRVPAHPIALELLHATQRPLAAPSANRFTQISPTRAAHVAAALGDRVDLILDGGNCEVGIESTVLDLSTGTARLLRPGHITRETLETIIGPIELAAPISGTAPRTSPGQVEKHYAPRARALLFQTASEVTRALQVLATQHTPTAHAPLISGALLREQAFPARTFTHVARLPHEADAYTRRLYAALHELDDAGCDFIFIENVPSKPDWSGVRDRLQRATMNLSEFLAKHPAP